MEAATAAIFLSAFGVGLRKPAGSGVVSLDVRLTSIAYGEYHSLSERNSESADFLNGFPMGAATTARFALLCGPVGFRPLQACLD